MLGLATVGWTIAKFMRYLVARGALDSRWVRRAAAFERRPGSSLGIVDMNAISGFRPRHGASVVAGTRRLPLAAFTIVVTLGRTVRFGAVCLAP